MNIVDGVLVSYDSPPKDLKISGVRVIGERALEGADIESVEILDVEEIAARAFMDCTSLCRVSLPESLRKIDDFAFSGTCVETVVLPDNVQLGEDVFFDSNHLSLVVSDSRIPKYKLPLDCKIVTRAVYEALQRVGADRKYRHRDDNLRVYIRKKNDMPRVGKRQAMRKATRKPMRKAIPKPSKLVDPPRLNRRSKRPAPTKTPPAGPRSGECTICLKPSCEHLNMSRRLGAPLMW